MAAVRLSSHADRRRWHKNRSRSSTPFSVAGMLSRDLSAGRSASRSRHTLLRKGDLGIRTLPMTARPCLLLLPMSSRAFQLEAVPLLAPGSVLGRVVVQSSSTRSLSARMSGAMAHAALAAHPQGTTDRVALSLLPDGAGVPVKGQRSSSQFHATASTSVDQEQSTRVVVIACTQLTHSCASPGPGWRPGPPTASTRSRRLARRAASASRSAACCVRLREVLAGGAAAGALPRAASAMAGSECCRRQKTEVALLGASLIAPQACGNSEVWSPRTPTREAAAPSVSSKSGNNAHTMPNRGHPDCSLASSSTVLVHASTRGEVKLRRSTAAPRTHGQTSHRCTTPSAWTRARAAYNRRGPTRPLQSAGALPYHETSGLRSCTTRLRAFIRSLEVGIAAERAAMTSERELSSIGNKAGSRPTIEGSSPSDASWRGR
mmetsp:Transcript_11059/g.32261  ORF Transcript_11059/g.32261 Transcript_11059/m.32261 type:complete len:433 (-) Transcript_11059:2114-3412(-)